MKEERIGFRQSLRIAGRALAVSCRTMGGRSLAVSAVGFLAAFLPAWISTVLARFTDQVKGLSQGEAAVGGTLLTLGTLTLLFLAQAAYGAAQGYFGELNTQRTVKYIKRTIIDCTSRVQYRYLDNEADFRNRLLFAEQEGGIRVAESMQQVLLVLQNLVAFGSLVTVLFGVSPWMVLALLLACVPSVVLSQLQKDEEYKEKTKGMKEGAMSVHLFYICAGANERCRSLLDVRFGGIFPWVKRKWRSVSDGYLEKKNAMTRRHVLCNCLADILRNVFYVGVLLLAVRRIYQDPSVGLGVFMLVFTLSGQLQATTTKLFVGAARFFGDIRFMKDFFALEDTPREALEDHPRTFDRADIVFDHVSFAYPGSERLALDDLSIRIAQGEKVAIVGENGSGKSTFINLLSGIHEATEGRITMGGFDIRGNLRAVRRAISVVFQSFGRYETTIRENITIADGTKPVVEERLRECARSTGALDFIEKQPKGFDEEVGTFSETGNDLSGGQWQKIAMTRAVYRDGARVMVLDEPTAALDPLAEAALYRDFSRLTGDRTTLLISHRLGITSVVDRVLVFDNGRIVEDGSHQDLMRIDGLYAKMYRAQAQWYVEK